MGRKAKNTKSINKPAKRMKRIGTLNSMTIGQIQSISAHTIVEYINPKSILDLNDEKFFYFTSEQLHYISAKEFSYFPPYVLEELYELHKDETDDVEVIVYDNRLDDYQESLIVSGNAKRLKNALRLQQEREMIQKEIDELKCYIIENYEINGAVPLRLVLAYIQDAYFVDFMNEQSFLKKTKIAPSHVYVPKEHKFYGEIFINKQEVIDFLNSKLENKNMKLDKIPKLVSIYSLIKYPMERRIQQYNKVRVAISKDNLLVVKINRQDLIQFDDLMMIIAIA